MSDAVKITRELLMEAGGWKEMKAARLHHEAGMAAEAVYEGGVLSALVRERGASIKAKLIVSSPTEMENLCSCPRARREGIICAQVLAAGLEVIDPRAAPVEAERPPGNAAAPLPAAEEKGDHWLRFTEVAEEGAHPVTCRVILPPKLASSWVTGRILVGIEIDWKGERLLLSAVPRWSLLFAGPRDAALLEALKGISPKEVPGMVELGKEAFLSLLDALAGHPRVSFGRKTPAEIAVEAYRPAAELIGFRLRARWDETLVAALIGEEVAWVLRGARLQPVAPGLPGSMMSVLGPGLMLEPARAYETVRSLAGAFDIDEEAIEGLPRPGVPEVRLDLEGSLNHLEARFSFKYREGAVVNPVREEAAAAELEKWGFEEKNGVFVLADRSLILSFHAHGFARLGSDWVFTTGERFDHAAKRVTAVRPSLAFGGSGSGWFEVALEYAAGTGEVVAPREIQRLLQTGQNHRERADGRFEVIDPEAIADLRETISDCDPGQAQPGVYRMDHRLGAFLGEAVADHRVVLSGKPPWKAKARSKIKRTPLGKLGKVLRPYQREGVEWMADLAERGMGGILADEMGLGKTLQALAFLKVIGAKRTLIVCPSTLVFNWVAEAARFVPELNVAGIDGPDRKKKLAGPGAEAAILVTSYALLRRDEATWAAMDFDVVILDEAQQIKNPGSQVAEAACGLKTGYRFALTGTPMENSLGDLWSVMRFAMPGYLGERKAFGERFEKPIASGEEGALALERRLVRRLKPVILRRLKAEVAADLPEKIEQTIFCELNPVQKEVYGSILRESRKTIADAEGGRKRMLALTALLRLRQACCDLRLLKLDGIDPEDASVKLETLEELLGEAIEGGHRVLVFSQFVEMLQVVVPWLAELDLKFCYLDGRTRNRAEVVKQFQSDAAIPVFLISLKAGGVGLNLTGADTVIHLDPWWNPAIEAQATDRAHRIGQTRAVNSYKLITRGTVEEKIVALQEKKKRMMAAVIDGGSLAAAASLSEAEIMELIGG